MSTDFIYTVDNAMPDALCDDLIARFEAHPGKAAGVTSAGLTEGKKSSVDLTLENFADLQDIRGRVLQVVLQHLTEYFIRYPFVGSVIPSVRDPVTGVETELDMDNVGGVSRDTVRMLVSKMFRCGIINIQRYTAGVGGYPHWHCETCPDEACEGLHRIVLWMFYLNDVAAGGETEFWFQNRKLRPKKGTIVIAPAGFTHTHRGNVPLSGDKYIITSWLLYNRAGQPPAVWP